MNSVKNTESRKGKGLAVALIPSIAIFCGITLLEESRKPKAVVEEPPLPMGCGTASLEMEINAQPKSNMTTLYYDGKKLFKANCASCQKPSDQKLTGPGLKGVMNRLPSREWAVGFIQNADSLLKRNDPYTLKLKDEYAIVGNLQHHFNLNKNEIGAILDYLQ
jgi:hypothetical protein